MILQILLTVVIILASVVIGYFLLIALFYRKVTQGKAIVRTGMGDTRVSLKGIYVIPVLHNAEVMDISLKQVQLSREGKDGLICKDNLRADIKVAFFVRVSPNEDDIKKVAQTIGCARASDPELLRSLFEAKFSEALKTVGKRFDFVELYSTREALKTELLQVIGKDLNGYMLDDAAIDYLEQTPLQFLDENNILDSEGIKKIRDLTARQITEANKIQRDREKEIKRQDVDAQEAILQLERQLAEKQEVQKRELATIRAREEAETRRIQQEELTKSERARIAREREINIEEENKLRDVMVAQKGKERSEAIENERVQRDRELEATERERIVSIAQIAKEKALEEEKKNIQDVIRDRVMVERAVVEEKEKIKDTEAVASAERVKKVALLEAEQKAQEQLVQTIKAAEAAKAAAELDAQRRIIEANAEREAVDKEAASRKIMADAIAEENAALGLSEARVIEAKAAAHEKEGMVEVSIMEHKAAAEARALQLKGEANAGAEKAQGLSIAAVTIEKGLADAKVLEAKALATQQMGQAEAQVIELKAVAEAKGMESKADAMKKMDGIGRDHEEFKLRLEKEKAVDLARISTTSELAAAQAGVLAEALRVAKIEIIGGEQAFFDRLSGAVVNARYVDQLMDKSHHLQDFKQALLSSDTSGNTLMSSISQFLSQFPVSPEDLKNLSLTALIARLMAQTTDPGKLDALRHMQGLATALGIGAEEKPANK
ncbi:MAG: flotillin family protein [Bacteroidia bacterium]|nr:flotillin family protein [Bacteroidia bacterium]